MEQGRGVAVLKADGEGYGAVSRHWFAANDIYSLRLRIHVFCRRIKLQLCHSLQKSRQSWSFILRSMATPRERWIFSLNEYKWIPGRKMVGDIRDGRSSGSLCRQTLSHTEIPLRVLCWRSGFCWCADIVNGLFPYSGFTSQRPAIRKECGYC